MGKIFLTILIGSFFFSLSATAETCPKGYGQYWGGTGNGSGRGTDPSQSVSLLDAEANAGNGALDQVEGEVPRCSSEGLVFIIGTMRFTPTGCNQNSGRLFECGATASLNYLCCCKFGLCT